MSRIRVKWSASLVRALPLEERLALLGTAGRIGGRRNARARKLVERWKTKKPFARDDAFTRRLRQLATDEPALARALGLAATRGIREHVREHRLWSTFARLTDRGGIGDPAVAWEGHRELLYLVQPLLDDALAALDGQLAECTSRTTGTAVLDIEAIRCCARGDLAAGVLPIIERVCLLELNILRLQGRLSGRDSRARFRSYVRMLRSGTHARRFFREYPVLLELLATRIGQWRTHVHAVVSAWHADRARVIDELFGGDDPGRLVRWSQHLGDSHCGGRAVATLHFESGRKLVYKPRSLDVDAGFNKLAAWCNKALPEKPLRTVRVLSREDHGWCEFIERDALAERADARDFYHRQGKFLALFYALHAGDMHCDNVIACGADPVYVDLETLFHAQIVPGSQPTGSQIRPISIAHTLMLSPMRMLGESKGERAHCVLGFEAEKPASTPAWIVGNAGTDEAALTLVAQQPAARTHLPHFDGGDIALDTHLDDVRTGFIEMYEMLMRSKDELLSLLPRLFEGATVRQVIRPTSLYMDFVRNSQHPHHLRDAVERRALFERLFEASSGVAWINRLLASEIRDLEVLDVPYFSRRFNDARIYDSRGEVVEQLEFTSPRDTVALQIASLNAADLQAQLEVLHYSLGTSQAEGIGDAKRMRAVPSGGAAADYAALIDAAGTSSRALAIADAIADRVIVRGDAHYWLCQSAVADSNAMTISPDISTLYAGQLGIALFLGTIGASARSLRHVSLARASLRTVGAWTDGGTMNLPELGVFTGVLGYPYVMASLACQLDDRHLLRECLAWFDGFSPTRFNDDIDVLGGSAGGVLFLHALMQVALCHGERIDRLRDCIAAFADQIVSARIEQSVGVGWLQAQQHEGQPLAGFAHGNAGIAAALYVAARVLDRAVYREIAREAIRYENTLHVPAASNWKDLRKASARAPSDQMMSNWCHGATGILLGRAWCLAAAPCDDPFAEVLRSDLLRAERTSLQAPQTNDSLCHGSFGNHDVHQFARALLANDKGLLSEPSIQAMTHPQAALHGLRCGDSEQTPLDGRFAPPDLMCGLAGIGYGLLRHAAPESVPSVLGLALKS